ncbi:hypothetical protein [Gordonia sp. (in: high G+C Gram-positive bacteria)]|uniref:hypothetical protein n=1 Tax=Gordonia sp. (in: high G+C Gram-positive bacteria) TaxID=84139 RepID=UPI00352850D1
MHQVQHAPGYIDLGLSAAETGERLPWFPRTRIQQGTPRRYRTIYIDISGKILTAADPVTADLANALVALRGGH